MTEITGKVIHGDGYGKTLGFPTANLDRRQYVREKIKVRLGVWAGWAAFGPAAYSLKSIDYRLKAAIVIGPIDKLGLPKIETHLLNFSGNLYGKKVTITLKKYIRPFKKYKNVNDLKKQIQKDVEKIKKLNLKYGPEHGAQLAIKYAK